MIHARLSAGEQVAASGSFKLREAALVAIASDPPPDVSGAPQAEQATVLSELSTMIEYRLADVSTLVEWTPEHAELPAAD